MAVVPPSTRFIGFSDLANLTERKTDYLNAISQPFTMEEIANAAGGGTTLVDIPFVYYPPAGITNAGPKFTYADGVNLISYHIKGISELNGNGDSFEQYLCSVNFPSGQPFLFPGSITGMIQGSGGGDFLTSPLASGAIVDIDGSWQPISNFQINLYNYGNNPQVGDAYYYALVATFTTNTSGPITGLMAYDYELLLPESVLPPTIFQD